MNDTLLTAIIVSICVGIPTLIALLVRYVIYRRLNTPNAVPGGTHKSAKPANPLLSALATVCLLVVLYLIFFTPAGNWPLVVLIALIGLAFGSAARK